jgi:N-acetylmuramoyl-L-alanine amidase
MNNNLYHLLRKLLTLFIIICCNILLSQSKSEVFTVVLDPGHGGKDPGNRGNGYYEKNIALKIALQVGAELKNNNNINVIYTRKKDVFVNLFKRAEIANKAKADLFISIHCDAHNSNAYGAGTFVLGLHANQRNFEIAKKENSVIFKEDNYEQQYGGFNPNNPESVISLVLMQEEYLDQSIKAANLIQEFFTKNLKRKNRTVKQAGFIVLKYTYMPSVLVETGFLTNKKEGKYLNSKKGQNEMSTTIADAIIKYKNTILENFTELSSNIVVENDSNNTYLKIQIASGSNFLELKSYNFNGLKQLSFF